LGETQRDRAKRERQREQGESERERSREEGRQIRESDTHTKSLPPNRPSWSLEETLWLALQVLLLRDLGLRQGLLLLLLL